LSAPRNFARRLRPWLTGALTSPRTREARRWIAERRRRRRGEAHLVHYFHQVDDPYSQLAAQVLHPLLARYDVELLPHLVGPPPDEAAPERARLEAFARKDAADVAPGYGLAFPAGARAPVPGQVQQATRVLAAALGTPAFARIASQVGDALWRQDGQHGPALEALAREHGAATPHVAAAVVAEGNQLRAKLGHYLGAMFYLGSEWYWGVDRLHHLERRLVSLGALRPGASASPIAPRPAYTDAIPDAGGERLVLEVYPSLRSPYTYIALERVYALARRHPVDLVLRPVLPMVMRGLPVPRMKQLYITLDTKREAEDLGVPFGRIADPVGRPVERAFSLYPWACERGRGAELLLAFTRAAFAEGIDAGTDAGLRHVVERAGLPWEEARERVDTVGWRDALEANREQLFALGLWGVPSFRLLGSDGQPDYATWGQDRIWRVESEIRARLARREFSNPGTVQHADR
jgi:2-hydroxychromene-2-carboxylate isomerase